MGALRNSNWSLSHLPLVSPAWRQMFHLPSFFFPSSLPPPERHDTEGIFQRDFHPHQGFCWAVNHKWHLPSHPHSATKVQLCHFGHQFQTAAKRFLNQLVHCCTTVIPSSLHPSKNTMLWPYTRRTLYSIWVFNQFLPHATFMYFFSYQILVKFISICLPQLFYVACLLHALWLPPLFTADFFALSTGSLCEWSLYQNMTTVFLLVSFALSKRQALYTPYIDSSQIKTS